MSKSIDRIRMLMSSLPTKDISLGHKFLDKRDFDSLKDLVDSALYKIRKSQNSESPLSKYKDINIDDVNGLKAEVDWYVSQLNIIDDLYEDEYSQCDFGETEYNEDYY